MNSIESYSSLVNPNAFRMNTTDSRYPAMNCNTKPLQFNTSQTSQLLPSANIGNPLQQLEGLIPQDTTYLNPVQVLSAQIGNLTSVLTQLINTFTSTFQSLLSSSMKGFGTNQGSASVGGNSLGGSIANTGKSNTPVITSPKEVPIVQSKEDIGNVEKNGMWDGIKDFVMTTGKDLLLDGVSFLLSGVSPGAIGTAAKKAFTWGKKILKNIF